MELRLLVAAVAAACCGSTPAPAPSANLTAGIGSRQPHRPNIVLFLQDDQDVYMGGWTPMRQADRLVAQRGVRAANWFIHTPVCCPSRAQLLTGRYFHNVRMPGSQGGCMHVDVDRVNPRSFAVSMTRRAGYVVGWFGKHMNRCPHRPPPGFDCSGCRWFANGGGVNGEPGGYLNATFSDFESGVAVSGKLHPAPGTYKADTGGEFSGYATSVIANKSIEWVRKAAWGPRPFLAVVAAKGPHIPSTPAPWYERAFAGLAAPRTPDYNASKEQLAGHHWLIAQQGPITMKQAGAIDELFRNRWRTLLSVDDAIAGMVRALDKLGVLKSTYILITSDHGFNLGQHRLPSCKLNVYDHALRIPMVISGPGIAAGSVLREPASNVDVAPTILGLAGLDAAALHQPMDGRSVVPLIVDPGNPDVLPATAEHLRHEKERWGATAWRTHHLIEYHSLGAVVRYEHLVDDPHSNTYRALRFTSGGPVGSGNMLYAEFTALKDWNFINASFMEIFDLDADPHQLHNLASSITGGIKARLHRALQKKWACSGLACEGQLWEGPEDTLVV